MIKQGSTPPPFFYELSSFLKNKSFPRTRESTSHNQWGVASLDSRFHGNDNLRGGNEVFYRDDNTYSNAAYTVVTKEHKTGAGVLALSLLWCLLSFSSKAQTGDYLHIAFCYNGKISHYKNGRFGGPIISSNNCCERVGKGWRGITCSPPPCTGSTPCGNPGACTAKPQCYNNQNQLVTASTCNPSPCRTTPYRCSTDGPNGKTSGTWPECTCPGGKVFRDVLTCNPNYPRGKQCRCRPGWMGPSCSTSICTSPLIYKSQGSRAGCCGCPSNKRKSGTTCVDRCPTSSKPHLRHWNGSQCVCTTGLQEVGGDRCCSTAACPYSTQIRLTALGSCRCCTPKPANSSWSSPKTSCTWTCNTGYTKSGNRCIQRVTSQNCTKKTCSCGRKVCQNAPCPQKPYTCYNGTRVCSLSECGACPASAPCGSQPHCTAKKTCSGGRGERCSLSECPHRRPAQSCPPSTPCGGPPPNCTGKQPCWNGDQVCNLADCPDPHQPGLATPATCEGE